MTTRRPSPSLRPILLLSLALAALPTERRARAEEPDEEPAPTTPTEREARERFHEGNEKYALGDYDGAVAAFTAATQLDPAMPGPYRNLGLVYVAMRRCDQALPNFSTYLRLRPTGKFTARVETEVGKCKALLGGVPAVPQSELALVTVRATSGGHDLDGVVVKVDGLLRGTPVDLQVTPGRHTIRVERSGYVAVERGVEIKANSTVDVTIELAPAEASGDGGAAGGRASHRALALGLLGLSAVALAAGGACGIAESANWRDATTLDRTTHTRADLQPYRDRGTALGVAAYTGYTVGLAALAASVIVFAVDVRRGEAKSEPTIAIAPAIGPSSGGLAAVGSF